MPGGVERGRTGIPFCVKSEKRYARERRKSRNGHTFLKKKREKVCPGKAKEPERAYLFEEKARKGMSRGDERGRTGIPFCVKSEKKYARRRRKLKTEMDLSGGKKEWERWESGGSK